MNEGLLIDATLSTSRASAAAIWRIRDSSVELGRTFGVGARVGLDVSLAIDRMESYALTVRSRIKQLDPNAFAIIMGHAGDGNLHVTVYHDDTPDKHDEMERLLYGLTREFDGSVSAEHGIGILKRPVPEAEPHRSGARDHAHAEARARPAQHPQPRPNFYCVAASAS